MEASGKKRKLKRKFTKKMQIKLMAIFAFILVLLVFLLVRIVYINLKDGKEYEKQVLSQENYDSRTLHSRRGEIQDRNGQLLAYNIKKLIGYRAQKIDGEIELDLPTEQLTLF